MPTLSRIFNLRVFLIPRVGGLRNLQFHRYIPISRMCNRESCRETRRAISLLQLSSLFIRCIFLFYVRISSLPVCRSISLSLLAFTLSFVKTRLCMMILRVHACMHACAFLQASLEGSYRRKEEGRVSTYGKARRRVYRTQRAKGYLIDFRSVDYIF